jgi:tRNA pseudouridine13 synthase
MKLKRIPEDFQVDEQIALQPTGGPVALYRLTKQSLGTLEAIDAVARRWKLHPRSIGLAGLKDRHALTRQFVTIHGGPRRGISQTNIELEFLGQTSRHIHASDITGNQFQIVLRDLTDADAASVQRQLAMIADYGLPNYFDNQRFGSLGVSGEFIAQPWCLGDYERALWLAIAEENVHDRPDDQQEKAILREQWGNWPKCRELLHGGHVSGELRGDRGRIAEFLVSHPSDFRRAIAIPRQDLRSLWLAAFQSHLWNQILAATIDRHFTNEQLAAETIGKRELPFFSVLNAGQRSALHNLALPLPSARLHLEEGDLKSLIDVALAREGIELRQVRVKYPRDSFFSKGLRPALFQPSDLTNTLAADELYPGQQRLSLRFSLPRGSYATILVKRATGIDPEMQDDDP